MSKEIDKIINGLPSKLKTVVRKFEITTPNDERVPDFLWNRFRNDNENDAIELLHNENIRIVRWAFKLQDLEMPDFFDGSKNIKTELMEAASIIFMKIFSIFEKDGTTLKACSLYADNEKVVALGISAMETINIKTAEFDKNKDKAEVYAEHYGVETDFDKLNDWEKVVFFKYCDVNKASNTQAGKK